jgi:hypothetical protein
MASFQSIRWRWPETWETWRHLYNRAIIFDPLLLEVFAVITCRDSELATGF